MLFRSGGKEAADRFVRSGAYEDDAEPAEEWNESAGHSFFSADIDASAENDDEKEVEGVKGQGVKAHDRVLLLDVRAICIECRLKSSGFCANRGKDQGRGRERRVGVPQIWAVLARKPCKIRNSKSEFRSKPKIRI